MCDNDLTLQVNVSAGKANCSKISLSPGSAPFRRSLGKNTAAYIAYAMRTGPVGLMVIPDSVAHASGSRFRFVEREFPPQHGAWLQGCYLVDSWIDLWSGLS